MHVINTYLERLETDLQSVPARHSHVSNSPLLKRSPPETPEDCILNTVTVRNVYTCAIQYKLILPKT